MFGLQMLGDAAEALKKILIFAETIEDRFERAQILDAVNQLFVLFFSPNKSRLLLEKIINEEAVTEEDIIAAQEVLHSSEYRVSSILDSIENIVNKYGTVLTVRQREALLTISYGKVSIRKALFDLLRSAKEGITDAIKLEAAALLDQILELNELLDTTARMIKNEVQLTKRVTRSGVRISFWSVIILFLFLWLSVTVTVVLGADWIRQAIS